MVLSNFLNHIRHISNLRANPKKSYLSLTNMPVRFYSLRKVCLSFSLLFLSLVVLKGQGLPSVSGGGEADGDTSKNFRFVSDSLYQL